MIIQHASTPITKPSINHQAKAQRYTLQMQRVIDGYLWQGYHIIEIVGHVNKKNLFISLERLNQLLEGETYLGSTQEIVKLNLKPDGTIESLHRTHEKIDPPDELPAAVPAKSKRTRKAKALP